MLSMKAAVDRFVNARWAQQRAGTARSDESFVKVHLLRHFGSKRQISDISSAELQTLFDDLAREGYELSTLKQNRIRARVFFRHFGLSTADTLKTSTPPEKDVRTWDDEELEALRQAAQRLGLEKLLELALATGGRKAELGALRFEAFNFGRKSVRFQHQIGAGSSLQPLKGHRAGTALVLPEWWRWQQQRKGFVLGEPWQGPRVYKFLRRVIERAGLAEDGVGVHSFRHTYARRVLEAGCSLEQLKSYLRHKSIQTTERFYGHLRDDVALALGRRQLYGEVAQFLA